MNKTRSCQSLRSTKTQWLTQAVTISGTSTSTAGPTKAKKAAINVEWIKTPEGR